MRILFDQGTPVPLRNSLGAHVVETVHELGWSRLSNGDLLNAAEQSGFDVFVTTDQNLRYQQNLAGRRIAIVVLPTTRWPEIRDNATGQRGALDDSTRRLPRSSVISKPALDQLRTTIARRHRLAGVGVAKSHCDGPLNAYSPNTEFTTA